MILSIKRVLSITIFSITISHNVNMCKKIPFYLSGKVGAAFIGSSKYSDGDTAKYIEHVSTKNVFNERCCYRL